MRKLMTNTSLDSAKNKESETELEAKIHGLVNEILIQLGYYYAIALRAHQTQTPSVSHSIGHHNKLLPLDLLSYARQNHTSHNLTHRWTGCPFSKWLQRSPVQLSPRPTSSNASLQVLHLQVATTSQLKHHRLCSDCQMHS